MPLSTKILLGALVLLMVDAIIEIAFISDMVAWLHYRAGTAFRLFGGPNGSFSIKGKPKVLLVDQGHTSNGAAGAAFVVVGLGGLVVLWLRHRQMKRNNGQLHGGVRFLYTFWLWFTVVSAVFSLAALFYVQIVTAEHADQHINLGEALDLVDISTRPAKIPYVPGQWTPQGWFSAMLQYGLVDPKTQHDVELHLAIMRGWQWNTIPMAVLGIVVMVLAWMDRSQDSQNWLRQLLWHAGKGDGRTPRHKAEDIEMASQ